MNRQQDLFTDLPRGERLKLRRSIELDPWQRKSVKISGKMQKAVLRVIDDHEGGRGCFPSQATIAAEITSKAKLMPLYLAADLPAKIADVFSPARTFTDATGMS